MHPVWSKNSSWSLCPESENHCCAHVDDQSGPGGLLPREIPGILNIYADREPIARGALSFAKTPQDHKSRPRHDVTRLSTYSNSSEKPVGTWGFFGKMHEASGIYGAGNGNRVNLAPLIRARSVVQVHPGPPFKSGPARRHGLHNVPKTWVTLLGRTDFRVVRAPESPDRSIPDHNP